MEDPILKLRLIDSLQKNVQILSHLLVGVTAEQTTHWRDGADGWTVLEVICHLRDYDTIFRERGHLMLAQAHPTFPVYDHLAMVVERAYNAQSLPQVMAELAESRRQTIAFFAELTEAQWALTGQHVEHGRYTMTSLAAHMAWHDANHLEQIGRILANGRAPQ